MKCERWKKTWAKKAHNRSEKKMRCLIFQPLRNACVRKKDGKACVNDEHWLYAQTHLPTPIFKSTAEKRSQPNQTIQTEKEWKGKQIRNSHFPMVLSCAFCFYSIMLFSVHLAFFGCSISILCTLQWNSAPCVPHVCCVHVAKRRKLNAYNISTAIENSQFLPFSLAYSLARSLLYSQTLFRCAKFW